MSIVRPRGITDSINVEKHDVVVDSRARRDGVHVFRRMATLNYAGLFDLPNGWPYHAATLLLPMVGQTISHYRIERRLNLG